MENVAKGPINNSLESPDAKKIDVFHALTTESSFVSELTVQERKKAAFISTKMGKYYGSISTKTSLTSSEC